VIGKHGAHTGGLGGNPPARFIKVISATQLSFYIALMKQLAQRSLNYVNRLMKADERFQQGSKSPLNLMDGARRHWKISRPADIKVLFSSVL
jgi:hypothetical protein